MAKRMLIDATHPEETRVVVLNGNRLEEFDYESASKSQLKGNIYLAKITRVEPSLQAAFVDYGGNRHGFLPFSEIHPDYYRIPIADRKALLAEEERLRGESAEEELAADEPEVPESAGAAGDGAAAETARAGAAEQADAAPTAATEGEVEELSGETGVDTVGGDEIDDAARRRARLLRKYKIQEVIKRRQVILVQVTKEERGNKGAALTTYLSLAGRYCVLMPNTGKGGGISRKINNAPDRRRLKRVIENLKIPDGVAVIVRTAGSQRTKAEIRRDYEYLLRLWSEIRDTTLASTAPCLIHEEANLIKRALRDLYQSDMDEILVDGEDGYKLAKSFMKTLMPSHARKVKQYKDEVVPLFYRHQVESQIDAMHSATVQLKSGGYVVINMTEALVAIDVNSGKATRERHIEETAYKTNLEAAEEIARQLRLRDLAGLIVIDFIDMEESRHNRGVERKLKEAMRLDRARIQLGRISPFGLLEMSRQRLRPSLFETSTVVCPQCNASGFVRTTESVALHVLRGLEEEGIRRGGGEVSIAAPPEAALHLLNALRHRIVEVEQRYGFRVRVLADASLVPPNYILEHAGQAPVAAKEEAREATGDGEKAERRRGRGRRRRKRDEEHEGAEAFEAAAAEPEESEPRGAEAAEDDSEERAKRRRRRGKRGGRRRARRRSDEQAEAEARAPAAEEKADAAEPAAAEPAPVEGAATKAAEGKPKRRRAPRRKKAAVKEDQAADTAEPAAAEREKTRAEAAKPPAETPAPEEAESELHEAEPAETARDRPAPSPAAEQRAHNGAESNTRADESTTAEDQASRRRGWWQRLSG